MGQIFFNSFLLRRRDQTLSNSYRRSKPEALSVNKRKSQFIGKLSPIFFFFFEPDLNDEKALWVWEAKNGLGGKVIGNKELEDLRGQGLRWSVTHMDLAGVQENSTTGSDRKILSQPWGPPGSGGEVSVWQWWKGSEPFTWWLSLKREDGEQGPGWGSGQPGVAFNLPSYMRRG